VRWWHRTQSNWLNINKRPCATGPVVFVENLRRQFERHSPFPRFAAKEFSSLTRPCGDEPSVRLAYWQPFREWLSPSVVASCESQPRRKLSGSARTRASPFSLEMLKMAILPSQSMKPVSHDDVCSLPKDFNHSTLTARTGASDFLLGELTIVASCTLPSCCSPRVSRFRSLDELRRRVTA
jgi:hypothetical protein